MPRTSAQRQKAAGDSVEDGVRGLGGAGRGGGHADLGKTGGLVMARIRRGLVMARIRRGLVLARIRRWGTRILGGGAAASSDVP